MEVCKLISILTVNTSSACHERLECTDFTIVCVLFVSLSLSLGTLGALGWHFLAIILLCLHVILEQVIEIKNRVGS